MNILDLLQGDGFTTKRVASTNGGEFASPCPFCRGNDRFRSWPEQGESGRWWCRKCGRSGDVIQYLEDYRKMKFKEACQYVGKEISSFTPSLSSKKTSRSHWAPRVTTAPTDLWQGRALGLVEASEHDLFHPYTFAQKMLGWLKETRGLSEETIKKYRLGLVPIDRFEGHEQWGLDPVLKEDGTPKKIWIPGGLTIPFCQGGSILRIRIRRPKADLKSDGDPRYYLLRGSDTRAMVLGQGRDVFTILESELDAILLFQEVGDLTGAISLGNAQARPDIAVMETLRNSKLILVALDGDDAGAKEAWGWWLNHFPQARRWPPVGGKDPGEMFLAGINLRTWIEAGIDEYGGGSGGLAHAQEVEAERLPLPAQEKEPEPEPEPAPELEQAFQAPQEDASKTCFGCPHFAPTTGPNPAQSWGTCQKRRRGRFGLARACEAMLTPRDASEDANTPWQGEEAKV